MKVQRKKLYLSGCLFLISFSLFFSFCLTASASLSDITLGNLKQKYDGKTFRLLIVPGHDDETAGGARFGALKEADLNLQLAKHLTAFFESDSRFAVFLSRGDNGYTSELKDYFENRREEIIAFRDSAKASHQMLLDTGSLTPKSVVRHNYASEEDAIKLYGINKWIADHDIDLAIHVHFNDYPDRPRRVSGDYSGASIYIPERQLPNHETSLALARSVFSHLTRYTHPSNNPVERDGIIEDQELIAIGSHASLRSPSLLIEYGYLSKPPIAGNARIRRPFLKELAYQTYRGVKLYFDPGADLFLAPSSFLPRRWNTTPAFGAKENAEVLALQIALSHENLYPAAGFDPHDCLPTGNFGPCTRAAVKAFQQKYGLAQTGAIGPLTLAKLNEIYDYKVPESGENFAYSWKKDLIYGMRNSDVAALQNALFLEQFYDDRITGIFSENTRAALKAFQQNRGIVPIPPQGVAGPRTRKILNELYSQ